MIASGRFFLYVTADGDVHECEIGGPAGGVLGVVWRAEQREPCLAIDGGCWTVFEVGIEVGIERAREGIVQGRDSTCIKSNTESALTLHIGG